jgi:hypothetical protein
MGNADIERTKELFDWFDTNTFYAVPKIVDSPKLKKSKIGLTDFIRVAVVSGVFKYNKKGELAKAQHTKNISKFEWAKIYFCIRRMLRQKRR